MISDLRAYFDSAIKSVIPTIEYFDEDVIGDEDVDNTIPEKFYKLIFGETVNEFVGVNSYRDELPITIILYGERTLKITEVFDELYENAIDIRDCVINPTLVKNQPFFTDIFPVTITPSDEETNSNAIKMTLRFNVQKDFRII